MEFYLLIDFREYDIHEIAAFIKELTGAENIFVGYGDCKTLSISLNEFDIDMDWINFDNKLLIELRKKYPNASYLGFQYSTNCGEIQAFYATKDSTGIAEFEIYLDDWYETIYKEFGAEGIVAFLEVINDYDGEDSFEEKLEEYSNYI